MFHKTSDLLRPAARKARDEPVSRRKEYKDVGRASDRATRSELASLFRLELKGRRPD